ncbi:MAG TPA: hypothetical protein VML55_22855 [Planctomycetaceae bacterium]|nr:hypothetical protein [Planctomycetaceae bacterium]
MFRLFVPVVVSSLVFLAGCGSGGGSGGGKDASPDSAEQNRLAGRYLLVISQRPEQEYVDIYAARLEFPEGEGGRVTLEHATTAFPSAELLEGSVKGGRVRLDFDSAGGRVDFEGQMDKGVVWGSFCVGGLQCVPARLVPAAGSDFNEENPYVRSEGGSELRQLQRSGADFEDMIGFCRRNPNSPAVLDIYAELVPYLGAFDSSEEQVRDYTRDYLKAAARWGERMVQIAQIRVGYGLVMSEHLPQVGLKYLHDGEKRLAPPQAEEARELIRRAESIVRRAEARELITKGDEARGVEILEALRREEPLDPVITHLLAVAAQQAGETERALELYGEIVALPGLEAALVNSSAWNREDELPHETLETLWEQAHGGSKPMSEFLDGAYVKAVSRIAASAEAPAAASGSRVVLGELFTGAQCGPCVAADVAGMALEATYPRSELIVLRYHQHSPAEDPLTSKHGEERFTYYRERGQPQGTPTFLVSGSRVEPGVGGMLSMAPRVYGMLRKQVDPLLAKDAGLVIELSAAETDGQLALKATVNGEVSDYLRLRLALAEDDLSFQARNGVRRHQLIVRHMPGGPRGIAPQDGRLAFDGTLSLDEVRRTLLDELEQYEKLNKVRFPVKPVELQPLYLVAFVQDERTKEVLQAAGVPVPRSGQDDAGDAGDAAVEAEPRDE